MKVTGLLFLNACVEVHKDKTPQNSSIGVRGFRLKSKNAQENNVVVISCSMDWSCIYQVESSVLIPCRIAKMLQHMKYCLTPSYAFFSSPGRNEFCKNRF